MLPPHLLSPIYKPSTRLSVWANDLVAPGAAHAIYRLAVAPRDRKLLAAARKKVALTPPEKEPLVSIRIGTFNRGRVLIDRAIRSALRQTHPNIEVVVVGDHCTDNTAELMAGIGDPRVRFENLPTGGDILRKPNPRWRIAGAPAWNRALNLVRGEWIATLDDDDEMTPEHVETLLQAASDRGLEMVWGNAERQVNEQQWTTLGGMRGSWFEIQHSSVLYSARLAFLRYSLDCWIWLECADTNLWKRMQAIGARMGHVDSVVTRAFWGGVSSSALAQPEDWQGKKSGT